MKAHPDKQWQLLIFVKPLKTADTQRLRTCSASQGVAGGVKSAPTLHVVHVCLQLSCCLSCRLNLALRQRGLPAERSPGRPKGQLILFILVGQVSGQGVRVVCKQEVPLS